MHGSPGGWHRHPAQHSKASMQQDSCAYAAAMRHANASKCMCTPGLFLTMAMVTSRMMPRRPTLTAAALHRCWSDGVSRRVLPSAVISVRPRSCASVAQHAHASQRRQPANAACPDVRQQQQPRAHLAGERAMQQRAAMRGGCNCAADCLVYEPGEGRQRVAVGRLGRLQERARDARARSR